MEDLAKEKEPALMVLGPQSNVALHLSEQLKMNCELERNLARMIEYGFENTLENLRFWKLYTFFESICRSDLANAGVAKYIAQSSKCKLWQT